MAYFYVVVVEHNVVQAIERSTDRPGPAIPGTPLEVAVQLADNHRRRGCIDGRYHFDDAVRARVFAELCLEFTKALVEHRLAEVAKLPAGFEGYRPATGASATQ